LVRMVTMKVVFLKKKLLSASKKSGSASPLGQVFDREVDRREKFLPRRDRIEDNKSRRDVQKGSLAIKKGRRGQ